MATFTDIDLPTLPGGSPGLVGVLGVPDGEGPWPGVVLVHELFGLNDEMRRQVERMTSAGFVVLMPDLFVDGGPRRCLRATFAAIARGSGRPFQDVEAARRTSPPAPTAPAESACSASAWAAASPSWPRRTAGSRR